MSNPVSNIFNKRKEETNNFLNSLTKGKPVIGIDFGTKNIGIAISDISLMIASPLTTIHHQSLEKNTDAVIKIIAERDVCGIVSGLPLQMNGDEGESAKAARKFATRLAEKSNLPVFFWDERLSTSAVERMMINEADLSRAKRKKSIDKTAAAFILQGALDSFANYKL